MDEEPKNSLFTDHAYKISITVDDEQQGLIPPERWAFTYNVSELSRRIFFALFNLIKNESLKVNYAKDVKDKFGNIVNVLFQRFNLSDLDEKGSLENTLKKYINELRDYYYYLPKNLVEMGRQQLKPNDVGIYYDELETIIKIFRDILKSLRNEKIKFWETLFKRYKDDKEGYDLEFRTKESRHKKDLDRVSKLTDEDIESLM